MGNSHNQLTHDSKREDDKEVVRHKHVTNKQSVNEGEEDEADRYPKSDLTRQQRGSHIRNRTHER